MKIDTDSNPKRVVKADPRDTVFENKIAGGRQLLTVNELAHFLNVKVKTLYSMVHRSEIPFIKVGRLLRFNREQIETWLSKRS